MKVNGEPLIQRKDDIPAVLKSRLESFHRQTEPVFFHFLMFQGFLNADIFILLPWFASLIELCPMKQDFDTSLRAFTTHFMFEKV